MGLVNYYRHFIEGCALIAEPINRLLRKDYDFDWSKEAQRAFEELKRKLTQAPILARPDFNLSFILHTDACATGLGAALSQIQGEKERVISYASRRTSRTEANYGATQLELLAVFWATRHYRHYLII